MHSDLIIEYKQAVPRSFAWESHFHPGCQLYLIHRGQVQMLLDDRLIPCNAGSLALIDALRLHYLTPHSPTFLRSLLHFLPSWLEQSISLPPVLSNLIAGAGPLVFTLNQEQQLKLDQEFARLFTLYGNWRQRMAPLLEQELKVRITCLLFDLLHWRETQAVEPAEQPLLVDTRASKAGISLAEEMTRYIASRVYEQLNLQMLQAEFKFSVHYLTHYFKEATGISPIRFWHLCRIKEAKRLLIHTNQSVETIATKLNFGTSQYFSQTFKQWVKISPSEFRKFNRSPHSERQ